jgi:SWI/SNF-related matrix-associated actin-dependent regulator of chromatin subfamily A-like protein 1
MSQSRRAFLVWDPGVGKTPTAVRACLKANARRVLVFAPPIGVGVWRQHFEDWSRYRVKTMDSAHALKPYAFMEGSGARIVPYSRARPGTSIMRAANGQDWDVVILDEGHYLKTSGAQRTRAIYGTETDLKGTPLERAGHVWVLTGTPILNHPAEFWSHLHALAPDTIILPQLGVLSEGAFTDRFCVTQATPYGVRVMGGRNSSELAQRIKPVIDRKRMKDVLQDLPELRIVEHPLPAGAQVAGDLRAALALAVPDVDQDDIDQMDDEQLLATVQAAGTAFSTVRRLIGRAKASGVGALANDMLDDAEDDKVIVFAHHREVIRDLTEILGRHSPLVITGATEQGVRESAIGSFQNDPKRRLIILAIEAAGEVITLHASHNVVIAEPSPVPAKNYQAIARAHRKGQRHPVLARFVLLPGTLDARLMSIIARKTRDIAQIVDGAPTPKNSQLALDEAFPDTA